MRPSSGSDVSPVCVTITGTEMREAFCPGKGNKSEMLCLKFKGAKKLLGMNMTNGELVEYCTGESDDKNWAGKTIWLRVAECGGDKCIRIHAVGAKLPKQCKPFRYIDKAPDQGKPSRPLHDEPQQAPGEPGIPEDATDELPLD